MLLITALASLLMFSIFALSVRANFREIDFIKSSYAGWKYGYVAFFNGKVLENHQGVSQVPIWYGARSLDAILHVLLPLSSINPKQLYILIKWDSSLPFNCIARRLPHITFLAPSSRSYAPPNVKRLPSPYYIDFENFGRCKQSLFKKISQAGQPSPRKEAGYSERIFSLSHIPWEEKKTRVMWRGSSTGTYLSGKECLRKSIVKALSRHPLTDVALVNQYISSKLSPQKQSEFQILLAIDGWGWPGSLFWNVRSGSLTIVISDEHMGYMDFLEEGKHYLYADELNIYQVVDWALNHPQKAKKIAEACQKKVVLSLSEENLEARFIKLFTEDCAVNFSTFAYNPFCKSKQAERVAVRNLKKIMISLAELDQYLGLQGDLINPLVIREQKNSMAQIALSKNCFKRVKQYCHTFSPYELHFHRGYADFCGPFPIFWLEKEGKLFLSVLDHELQYSEFLPWPVEIASL